MVTMHAKGASDPSAPLGSPGPGPGMPMGSDAAPGRGGRGRTAGPKNETYQVDTSNVLFILSGAFVGLDKVVLDRMSEGSIGFDAPLPNENESKSGFMPFFTSNEKKGDLAVLHMVEPGDLIRIG